MKYLFIALLLLCYINTQAQKKQQNLGNNFITISKADYDSLMLKTWYKGRVFFIRDNVYKDGWIHRVANDAVIQFSHTKGGEIQYISANQIQGFYDIIESDTVWFVFLDVNPKPHKQKIRSLRILYHGDVSLLVWSWLIEQPTLWGGGIHEIYWNYYLYKDYTLYDVMRAKDIKKVIQDKPEALNFYKENKKMIHHDYELIIELLEIYDNY